MIEELIVLRAQRSSLERRTRSEGAAPLEARSIGAAIEAHGPEGAQELAKDPAVLALAPAMPIMLIAPVGNGAGAPPPDPVAWGVRAVRADQSKFDGSGVKVAVLDTGIAKHKAFDGMKIVQKDFTGEGDGDINGHGTHCAGTVFGRDVDGVRIGVAPGVSTGLIGKVLSKTGGSTAAIVRGLMWAVENDAHVITMSLGIDFPGYVRRMENGGLPTEMATSHALDSYRKTLRMFDSLADVLGSLAPHAIVIAAAGNESRRLVRQDFKLSVAPPAVCRGILSVGALGRQPEGLSVAHFSNTGPAVCAPGVDIVSAGHKGGLATLSGTSMAAPHVAGVAALWAHKLRDEGAQDRLRLTSLLEGRATTAGLVAGFDPGDIGAGMVVAP